MNHRSATRHGPIYRLPVSQISLVSFYPLIGQARIFSA
jgi:hypothetical protein